MKTKRTRKGGKKSKKAGERQKKTARGWKPRRRNGQRQSEGLKRREIGRSGGAKRRAREMDLEV